MKHLIKLLSLTVLVVTAICLTHCGDEEKPKTIPTVETTPVTDFTTTTAVVGGKITDNGNIKVTEAGIVYSDIVSEPTIAETKVEITDFDDTFSTTLDGLSSGTEYHVRAYAINSKGIAYGEVKHFETGNAAPTATSVSIAGTMNGNDEVSADYDYTDSDGDNEGTTTFKWYVADNTSGAGALAIEGATEQDYKISPTYQDKYIAVGVTPVANTGTLTGVEVKSAYLKVGEPTTITFTYFNNEVTYGILVSTKTQRKWMDRNLGASSSPVSSTDFSNYGDMFQWGRLADGHQTITRTGTADNQATGVTGKTSTVVPYEYAMDINVPLTNKFIIVDPAGAPFDWRKPSNDDLWRTSARLNNPCPSGWHVPTKEEWAAETVDNTITNMNEAFSKLKITFSGIRGGTTGDITSASAGGYFWTSTLSSTPVEQSSVRVRFNDGGYNELGASRANAYSIRCIKDL